VIEKPFGYDLESARDLNDLVHSTLTNLRFTASIITSARKTVQNLLVFRFANPISRLSGTVIARECANHSRRDGRRRGAAGYYDTRV